MRGPTPSLPPPANGFRCRQVALTFLSCPSLNEERDGDCDNAATMVLLLSDRDNQEERYDRGSSSCRQLSHVATCCRQLMGKGLTGVCRVVVTFPTVASYRGRDFMLWAPTMTPLALLPPLLLLLGEEERWEA